MFLNDVDWDDWNKMRISRKFKNSVLPVLWVFFLERRFCCFVHYALYKSTGVSALHIIEELGKRQLVDLKPKMYLPDSICKLINNYAESAYTL